MLITIVAMMISPEASRAQDAPAKDAKKPVACSVKILTELNVAAVTLNVEAFGPWARPIIEGVESRFRGEKAGREVVIRITLRRKGDHEVIIAGRPSVSEAEAKDLRALVDLPKAPRPKIVDFAFEINALIRGGDPDKSHELTPKLGDPVEARVQAFARALTAEQVAALRSWAVDEAIPVLAAMSAKVDPKFPGVIRFGRTLGRLDVSRPIDVEALTYRSPDFWRATLEMNPGDPLTPTALIALYCASGELDKARRVGEVAAFFDARQSGPSRLLGEFRLLDQAFETKLNARVNEGISLHDKDQFGRAIEVYKGVLRDYPKSAWATYELFHTERSMLVAKGGVLGVTQAGWPDARKAILAADPLYAMMGEARGPDETYQLLRRLQISTLFKNAAKAPADLLEYADIARDLDQDGFAALIDWYAFARLSTKARGGRDVLEEFLYSLERLGIKDIKANFEGDHPAAFARLDARRKKAREESAARKVKDDKAPPAKPGP
jgi:hypothetical protein